MRIQTLVGTLKGAFLFTSDGARERWTIEGPLFKGWKVTASERAPDGTTLVATASDVYGPAIHTSQNLTDWRQIEAGPAWPEEGGRKLNQIWILRAHGDSLFAGVDEAGLFRSEDAGESWQPVEGLNEHATRDAWFPGAGGLCAHSILFDESDPNRSWCGISAVGVFRSDDGGLTWTPKNEGIRVVIEDEEHKEIGFCVHALAQDPTDPGRIYRQDHAGMYRSSDGGDHWEKNDAGLVSSFGFPIVIDRATRNLFAIPLESDEYRIPNDGALRVYRSSDNGDSWEAKTRGLPQEHAYAGVLRGALAVDHLDECGVYFGTTAGSVYFSRDGGESFEQMPCTLPRVMSVRTYLED
jgi:hypothetical protein